MELGDSCQAAKGNINAVKDAGKAEPADSDHAAEGIATASEYAGKATPADSGLAAKGAPQAAAAKPRPHAVEVSGESTSQPLETLPRRGRPVLRSPPSSGKSPGPGALLCREIMCCKSLYVQDLSQQSPEPESTPYPSPITPPIQRADQQSSIICDEQCLLSEQALLFNLHVLCIHTGITSLACMQGVQQQGQTRQHREARPALLPCRRISRLQQSGRVSLPCPQALAAQSSPDTAAVTAHVSSHRRSSQDVHSHGLHRGQLLVPQHQDRRDPAQALKQARGVQQAKGQARLRTLTPPANGPHQVLTGGSRLHRQLNF